jgi:hypothetical protein
LENALIRQEKTGRANTHESAFALWVLLLCFGVGLDDCEDTIGLGVALEDSLGAFVAARDDDDIPLSNTLLGFCKVEVGSEGGALGRNNVF